MKLKAVREEVRGLIRKWKPRLYLDMWDIDIDYFDGPIPGFEHALAVCTPTPNYYLGRIRVNYPEYAKTKPDRRETVIVHELLHLLCSNAIDDQASKETEQLVSTMAIILMDQQRRTS